MLQHRPLPAIGDPFYPSLNKTIPPKPSRADGTLGRRLQSSVRGQQLCKAPSPPVSQVKGRYDTPRSLLCPPLQKPQAKRHLAGRQHQHGRAGEPTLPLASGLPLASSPLHRAQLQLKRRFNGGSYKNPSLRLEQLLRSALRGPQAPAPATLTGRKVHAGFLHECTRVEASLGSGPSTSECQRDPRPRAARAAVPVKDAR